MTRSDVQQFGVVMRGEMPVDAISPAPMQTRDARRTAIMRAVTDATLAAIGSANA